MAPAQEDPRRDQPQGFSVEVKAVPVIEKKKKKRKNPKAADKRR